MSFGKMYILLIGYLLLQITILFVDNSEVVSEEIYDWGKDRSQEVVDFDSYRSNRRFKDETSDEEWHIAHLKDAKTGFEEDCKYKTFEERARKYRRTLREDGAQVKFVLAEALPVDEEDLKDFKDRCFTYNDTKVDGNKGSEKTDTKSKNNKMANKKVPSLDESLDSVTINSNTATTVSAKASLTTGDKNEYANKSRRSDEYQFSSVEYYEDILDFDKSKCPNDVEVIILQIDQLRSYDIECETIIEWRSLE